MGEVNQPLPCRRRARFIHEKEQEMERERQVREEMEAREYDEVTCKAITSHTRGKRRCKNKAVEGGYCVFHLTNLKE